MITDAPVYIREQGGWGRESVGSEALSLFHTHLDSDRHVSLTGGRSNRNIFVYFLIDKTLFLFVMNREIER